MIDNLPTYTKWPTEELFGNLMLQYNLAKSDGRVIDIPFRVIECEVLSSFSDPWSETETKVRVLLQGKIIWEGIRHCNFASEDNGYMNYPDIHGLALCLNRLHELCLEYCEDY